MTPTQLAEELGIDSKRLRRWLRSRWQGPGQGGLWHLSEEQVAQARAHFGDQDGGAVDGTVVRAAGTGPLRDVEELADWSSWVPLATAIHEAPRGPGVYMARGIDKLTV